ncbi:cytochrome b/b6 domain-containing protein [Vibrio algarum]|uniref:Cytochrome b/b6 domain-containing protein n=1 Tax=Vibrio algarum TaxID=3020714 RepID=A0ABT4YV67_9VIBR|nr:cytochrome b/b6 domain-containing protein [Vibrio sp. KJ40-1]MDB1125479.1 cytochrome b/b6 domain-containing protein [Vibrio sp. KJ40-1]
MNRYSPALIVLHWALALALFVALFMGGDIASLSNDLDLKVDRLVVHMSAGGVIGALFVVRLVAIYLSRPIMTDKKANNRFAKLVKAYHLALYFVVFAIVLSGIAIAIQINMKGIV